MATLHLYLLGHLDLVRDGERLARDKKPLLVPAALAMAPGGRASRRTVARWIWPQSDKRLGNLRDALSKLNQRAAPATLIEVDGDHLVLSPEVVVDLWDLETAVDAGQVEVAMRLRRGRLLRYVEHYFSPELENLVESTEARLLTKLAGRLTQASSPERSGQIATWLGELRKDHGLNERLVDAFVRASDEAGRPVDALAAYAEYRVALALENDEPSPKLTRYVEDIDVEAGRSDSPEQQAESIEQPPSAFRRREWFSLGVLFAGFVVLTALLPLSRAWEGADGWPTGDSVVIPIRVAGGYVDLIVDSDGVHRGPSYDLPPDYVKASGAPVAAFTAWDSAGANVAVQLRPGDAPMLFGGPPDDKPLSISPDGTLVLVRNGAAIDDGRAYEVVTSMLDVRDGSMTHFREVGERLGARWSPSTRRIALMLLSVNDEPDTLLMMQPSGREISATPVNAATAAEWAPGGNWVAFVESDEFGDRVRLADITASPMHSVLEWPGVIQSMAWLTDNIILFIAGAVTDPGGDLWALDVRSGEASRVTTSGDLRFLNPSLIRSGSYDWLDDLPISLLGRYDRYVGRAASTVELAVALPQPLVPHEHVVPYAEAVVGGHQRIPVPESRLRYVELPDFLVESPLGGLRVIASGSGTLRANLGGYADFSLNVVASQPLDRGPGPVLLVEHWDTPRETELRWRRFGVPSPTIDYDRKIFLTNGDENHMSGVVSAAAFSTHEGLTLQLDARAPLTDGRYQNLEFGFVEPSPQMAPTAELRIGEYQAVMSIARESSFRGRHERVVVPTPGEPERARSYALQISPTGLVTAWVDGQLMSRVENGPPPDRVQIVLGGNSLGTEIAHGAVRLSEGLRFDLPDPRRRE